jgi:methylmalonyl-CoA mutase (EC 5.4.99.2)
MDTDEKIKESLQKWEERVLNLWLAKRPERKKAFTTPSGIEVRRLYTPLDLKGTYGEKIGFPGDYPFTRGIYPTMYRGSCGQLGSTQVSAR